VKIAIKNFQKKIPVSPVLMKKAAVRALAHCRALGAKGELTVCFVSDARMRWLNRKYKNSGSATDVLAFEIIPLKKKECFLADVVISADTAARCGRSLGTGTAYELCLYLVHGILHLFGRSDKSARRRLAMHREAAAILKTVVR